MILGGAPTVERDPYGTIRAVFVSAATGLGLQNLREAIAQRLLATRHTWATTDAAVRTDLAA